MPLRKTRWRSWGLSAFRTCWIAFSMLSSEGVPPQPASRQVEAAGHVRAIDDQVKEDARLRLRETHALLSVREPPATPDRAGNRRNRRRECRDACRRRPIITGRSSDSLAFAQNISDTPRSAASSDATSGGKRPDSRGKRPVTRGERQTSSGEHQTPQGAPDFARGTPDSVRGTPDFAWGAPDFARGAPDSARECQTSRAERRLRLPKTLDRASKSRVAARRVVRAGERTTRSSQVRRAYPFRQLG
jgi:hypothetical protein